MSRRTRWGVELGVVLSLSACASGAPAERPPEAGTVRTTGSFEMNVDVTRADRVQGDTVALDPARAWAGLPAVFRYLELPVNQVDRAGRRLGVSGFRPRRIENQPLSRYLDCGRGVTAAPNADSYFVFLWVETRVTEAPGDPSKAMVETTVTANARPSSGAGNALTCRSSGRLERRIAELLLGNVPSGAR